MYRKTTISIRWIEKNALLLCLLLLLILGGVLRFTNLAWDEGLNLNGDETGIIRSAMDIRFFSQMDPKFYSYNGFTMYIARIAGLVFSKITNNTSWLTGIYSMTIAARIFAAATSVATLFIIYQTGKLLKSKLVGFYAMALTVGLPLVIQTAHYATADNYLPFFFCLLVYFSLKYAKAPSRKTVILCAIASGLAIGSKQTGLFFLLVPYACFIFGNKKTFVQRFGVLALFSFIAILTVLATVPYIFSAFDQMRAIATRETMLAAGTLDVGWNKQFRDTGIGTFFVNMIYSFGFLYVISGMCAIFYSLQVGIRKRQLILAVLSVWTLIYMLFHGAMYVKFARYLTPLLVPLSLLIAYMMHDFWNSSKRLGPVVASVVFYGTLFYGMLYTTIFLYPHPFIAASKWMYQHIPVGSTLVKEGWNSTLPLSLNGKSPDQYRIVTADFLEEPDTLEKVSSYRKTVADSQYIVLAVERIAQNIQRLRRYYPFSAKFYDDLEQGQLGYHVEATFNGYPKLFGWEFGDLYGMNDPTLFDNRKVVIYKKG